MKIVADENIPLAEHYFGSFGELKLMPGRQIKREDLLDVDILLVRSITKVDKSLLHHTPVKFVGSATTGSDHLDIPWLKQAGISWALASGCNANAVVEYVISIVAALQEQGLLLKPNLRAGVIGVGNIGSQVVQKLKLLGFEVIQCDPFRGKNENNFMATPLADLEDLDFITVHTPLTFQGDHPTYHMLEKAFLERQKSGCVLLNSSRGSVINFADLKVFGRHLHWCLDVWENEPNIDEDILRQTLIATPHIAGYSVHGKYRGTEMIFQSAREQCIIPNEIINRVELPTQTIHFDHTQKNWRDVVLQVYDPSMTSEEMKDVLLHQKNTFDSLRKFFVERYEFGFVELEGLRLGGEDLKLVRGVGFVLGNVAPPS